MLQQQWCKGCISAVLFLSVWWCVTLISFRSLYVLPAKCQFLISDIHLLISRINLTWSFFFSFIIVLYEKLVHHILIHPIQYYLLMNLKVLLTDLCVYWNIYSIWDANHNIQLVFHNGMLKHTGLITNQADLGIILLEADGYLSLNIIICVYFFSRFYQFQV